MNAAQIQLINETRTILADLKANGSEKAATAARKLILKTTAMLADLGPVTVADLAAALAG